MFPGSEWRGQQIQQAVTDKAEDSPSWGSHPVYHIFSLKQNKWQHLH